VHTWLPELKKPYIQACIERVRADRSGNWWYVGLRADMGGARLATRLSCAPEQAAML